MLDPVMFTGGVYKHDLVTELIEDLGGYQIGRASCRERVCSVV